MREYCYKTPHGIHVTRSASKTKFRKGLGLHHLLRDLDRHRGIYLSSGYEFPGRYSRWDIVSTRSEEHTSELQSLRQRVCRLLLEKSRRLRIPSSTRGIWSVRACQMGRAPV